VTDKKTIFKRHPVLTYFVLTFIISWGGVLIMGAPHGMPTTSDTFEELYPIVFLPYLFGPLLSSLIATALIDGKDGLRRLFSRLLNWRVNGAWYAAAFLMVPLLALGILLPLSLVFPAYLPAIFTADQPGGLLLTGIAIGLFGGGLLEEPGWTGFALPRLRKRHDIFTSGLILGLVWGVWHFLPTYWGSGDAAGNLSLALLVPPCVFYAAVLPAFRVLMAWVYDRTQSLPVIMLMHASLTASTLFVLAPAAAGRQLILYYLLLAVVLWSAAAAVRVIEE